MTTTKKYYTGAAIWVIILLLWISCQKTYAQDKKTLDSIALVNQQAVKVQEAANKFIDSLETKTSVRDFKNFLYENVSGKQYNEGKFIELYNFYIQSKYDIWLREKQKPKPR